jgi:hypothetical protein
LTLFSQDEESTLLHNLFNQMDLNLDGYLSVSEAEGVLTAMDTNSKLEKECGGGGVYVCALVWRGLGTGYRDSDS